MINLGDARRTPVRCQLMQTPTLIIGLLSVVTLSLNGCSEVPPRIQMQVVNTMPEEGGFLPSNQAIKIEFNDYLDLESLVETDIALNTGAEEVSIDLSYDPVDKMMLIIPRFGLRVGVGYELTVPSDTVRSMSGGQLTKDLTLRLRAGPPTAQQASPPPLNFDTDIRPIFEASCGCHGPAPKLFPELTPEFMLRRNSVRQPDRSPIEPGQPLESYLIQRLLPDFPGVRGPTKMLSNSEKKRLVLWVRQMSGTR